MIKLTLANNGKPVYIAVVHIVAMLPAMGNGTLIRTTSAAFEVKQTLEQIMSATIIKVPS